MRDIKKKKDGHIERRVNNMGDRYWKVESEKSTYYVKAATEFAAISTFIGIRFGCSSYPVTRHNEAGDPFKGHSEEYERHKGKLSIAPITMLE